MFFFCCKNHGAFFDEYKLKNSIYLLLNVFVLISFDQFITSLLNKSFIIYLYIYFIFKSLNWNILMVVHIK